MSWKETMRMAKEVTVIKASPKTAGKTVHTVRKLRVAAYCRVSTEAEEQLNSFENQVSYYTAYINSREEYEMAGIYADEGISGTSTKKREDFKRMISDCEAGKIDLVIVKSISRFARNTQDCLTYARKLKNIGIGVFFEKENINTMDGAGELLFTILSSLAQEESRSISENCKWGIRKKFSDGKLHLNANRFLGYDKDEKGNLVINREQAETVRRIYAEFMDGINPDVISKRLNEEGVPGCMGEPRWSCSTIWGVLSNEKYMGDAVLQKTFTSDFLTKKTEKNNGQLVQYHVQDDHEAIIEKSYWEAVQMEIERRHGFMEEHGLRTMGRYTDEQPFSSRVICGACGNIFWRRTLTRGGKQIKVWMCGQRYRKKGVVGCASETVKETELHDAFIRAWNQIIEDRASYLAGWKADAKGGNPLLAYRAGQMMELTKGRPLKKIDMGLVSKVLDHCVIHSKDAIDFYFLDGNSVKIQ
jgi:DNA invertase Pin-like site-specific DNA recombinase